MNTKDTTAQDFDLTTWIADAKLPEKAATVYQRADLIGTLSDLERRIKNERSIGEAELGGTELVRAYRDAVKAFEDSALTVYVRAVPPSEQKEIAAILGDKADKSDVGAETIAVAITAVQKVGGERTPVKFTRAQVLALDKAVGSTQMQLIYDAWKSATFNLPFVDADFLQESSGPATGDDT